MSDRRTILILSANPKSEKPLRLGEEIREIKRLSESRDLYKVETAEAVRVRDIREAMFKYRPKIVHFCGHGEGKKGLVFEDEMGQAQLVGAEALADLFGSFADELDCVLLNTCYSEVQAQKISQYINHVIGMSQKIGDRAAIEFAVGFYTALGAGETVGSCYKHGCNAINMQGLPEHLTPELLTKNNSTKAENTMTSQRVFISYRSQEPDVIEAAHAVIPPHINTAPYLENYQSLLQEHSLIRIKAPNKMGKTRLVNHIFNSFNSNNYRKVLLSMEEFDGKDQAESERLFYRFCQEISNQLNLPNFIDDWRSIRSSGYKLRCIQYFDRFLLPSEKSPIVIVIDDLNRLDNDPTYKEFCSMLRSFYNRCATSSTQSHESWGRLGLIIAYSRRPVLPDKESPFNVGKVIRLPEFTIDEVQSLAEQHGIKIDSQIVSRIMKLVGGHPYLINLSFEHLKKTNHLKELLIKIQGEQLSKKDVPLSGAVYEELKGIYSDHLNKLLRKIQGNQSLEDTLYNVISTTNPIGINPLIAEELEGMGLVKLVSHYADPSCELYRIFFQNTIRRA